MSVTTEPQLPPGTATGVDVPVADPTATGDPSARVGAAGATPPVTRSATDVMRRQGAWLLGPRARTALLALLTVLVAVLLVAPPATGAAQDFTTTASSLTTAMAARTGVTAASGGYLPGTGIVLVSSVTGVASGQLNGILAAAMGPVSAQLADLPGGEAVSWQATLTATDGIVTTWLIRVGADDVDDQSRWVAVPVAGATAATGTTATTGATAAASAAATAAATASTIAASTTPAATTSASAASTTAAATTPAAATAAPATAAPTADAAAGTVATADTTSGAGSSSAAAAVGGPQSDDFAAGADAWEALTGTWAVVDGTYQQSDAAGYDYISQFTSTLPAAYTVSVKLKGLGDTVNGGIIIGQPALGSRRGATIVDLASKDYIRWGTYDATSSTYKFTGGAALGAAQAAADWHTLSITVKADGSAVSWNGKQVGTFAAVAPGFAGLVSSQSAIAFDDFTVTAG